MLLSLHSIQTEIESLFNDRMLNILLVAVFVIVTAVWIGSIYLFVWVSKASMPKKQRVLHYLAIFIKNYIFEKYPEDETDPEIKKTKVKKYNKMTREYISKFYGASLAIVIGTIIMLVRFDIIVTLYMILIILPLALLNILHFNMFLFVSMQVELDHNLRLKPIQLFWIDKTLICDEPRENV
ncbi:MAG: hypothetical protein Q7K29_01070 [Thermoleophilia bacterium]|nr:hypothetical protein [Thermoleophilia bacterium]